MALSRRPLTAAVMTMTVTVTVLLLTLTAASARPKSAFSNPNPNPNPNPSLSPSPSPAAMAMPQRSMLDYLCWNCDDRPYVYHIGTPGLATTLNDQKFSAVPDMAEAAHHMPMPTLPMTMPHNAPSQGQEKGKGAPH